MNQTGSTILNELDSTIINELDSTIINKLEWVKIIIHVHPLTMRYSLLKSFQIILLL
jgi:hypothetical protein